MQKNHWCPCWCNRWRLSINSCPAFTATQTRQELRNPQRRKHVHHRKSTLLLLLLIYFLNSCKRMNSMAQPQPAALPASSWRSKGLWGGLSTLEPTPTPLSIFCLSDFSPSRSLSLLTFCRRERGNHDRSSLHSGCDVFSVAKYFAHLLFRGDFFPPQSKKEKRRKKKGSEKHVWKSSIQFCPSFHCGSCVCIWKGEKKNLTFGKELLSFFFL